MAEHKTEWTSGPVPNSTVCHDEFVTYELIRMLILAAPVSVEQPIVCDDFGTFAEVALSP